MVRNGIVRSSLRMALPIRSSFDGVVGTAAWMGRRIAPATNRVITVCLNVCFILSPVHKTREPGAVDVTKWGLYKTLTIPIQERSGCHDNRCFDGLRELVGRRGFGGAVRLGCIECGQGF